MLSKRQIRRDIKMSDTAVRQERATKSIATGMWSAIMLRVVGSRLIGWPVW